MSPQTQRSIPRAPTPLRVMTAAIPAELTQRRQWVVWAYEWRDGKWTKPPHTPATGTYAKSNDPATWDTFESAVQAAHRRPWAGIGYMFHADDPYVGLDLDHCLDPSSGDVLPDALALVDRFASYTERSAGGAGLHLIVKGALRCAHKTDLIEAYSHGRYFTMTGHHFPGTPVTIESRGAELAAWEAEHFPVVPTPPRPHPTAPRAAGCAALSDEMVIEKLCTAHDGGKGQRLWDGETAEYGDDESRADAALCCKLAFFTNRDAGQIDRLFRRSGLARPKWDEPRGQQTYGARTIAEALAHVRETYSPHEAPTRRLSDLSVADPGEWPEPLPIKAELLRVEPLPLSIIPLPFRAWIKDVSDRMQCPPDFVAAGMLVMAGSIIGAGCGIRPKKNDDWMIVPNLWGGVVGRPSMLKTPAIGEAMKPLEGLEVTAKREYDAVVKDHHAEVEAHKARREALQGDMRQVAKSKSSPPGPAAPNMESLKQEFARLEEPKPPVWRRYKTNDSTIEKMGELQANNPRGLLLFRDELIGLFATWDKDGHESDRAFYLEGWNGVRPYTSDRIGRGTVYVENLCVSLFGGIQPAKLSGYLHAAMRGHNNDGMVQRLQVLVYPDELETWTLADHPINASAKQTAYQVVQRLAKMDFRQYGAFSEEGCRIPYFRFADDAQGVFYDWLTELETKLRKDDEPVILEHLGKYRSLMPALALEFHLLNLAQDPCPPPSQVSTECAEQAAAWCEYLETHARRVYGMVTNLTAQAASRLAGKLEQGALPQKFTVRDVYRKEWSLLDDRQVIENACEELVSLGWLQEVVTPSAPGQRGKTEYLTNPKVKR